MPHYMGDLDRWLRQTKLSEEALVRSPELTALLDPHRLVGPLPFRCGRERCKTTIAYWALTATDNRVAFGPGRREDRIKGIYPTAEPRWGRSRWQTDEQITSAAADLVYPGLPSMLRFDPHIEWAMQPGAPVRLTTNPDVKSPYPLRFTFTCPKCRAEYPFTNSEMIRRFALARDRDSSEVRP